MGQKGKDKGSQTAKTRIVKQMKVANFLIKMRKIEHDAIETACLLIPKAHSGSLKALQCLEYGNSAMQRK